MNHLPDHIAAALRAASDETETRTFGYSVRAGGREYPVSRQWRGGFALRSEDAPRLRGFVDLMRDGEREAHCLIVLASEDDGVTRYEYKLRTAVTDAPPLDYARAENAPVGLLT